MGTDSAAAGRLLPGGRGRGEDVNRRVWGGHRREGPRRPVRCLHRRQI